MKKIFFRLLGIALMILMLAQVSATPAESVVPIIVAVASAFGVAVCFCISENRIVEEDDDDCDRN